MLLLTLLPFVGWSADDVTVGSYTVTLDSKVVTLPATGNATAPNVASVTTGGSGNLFKAVDTSVYQIDNNGKLATAGLNAVGTYFLKVTTTDNKTFFVPFWVGKGGDEYFTKEYIWNETNFNASVGNLNDPNIPHGILYGYYKVIYPYSETATDYDPITHQPSWNAIGKNTDWRALMFPQINYKVKGLENGEQYAVYATYKKREVDPTQPQGYQVVTEGTYTSWDAGTGKPDLYGNNNFWMLSIPELYKGYYPLASANDNVTDLNIGEGYVLNYDGNGNTIKKDGTAFTPDELENDANIADALAADFRWDDVQFYLVPQVDPFEFSISLDYYETVYAGTNTRKPVVTYKFPEGSVPEGYEYTWYNSEGNVVTTSNPTSENANPFANVGTYTVVAKWNDRYAVAQYVVKPLELTVGAGNLYIGYGDPDPTEPNYGTVFKQLAPGDNSEDIHISGLSVVRKTPKTGTEPEPVNTVIPYTILEDNPSTGNPNYSLKVTPTDGNIIVNRKFLNEDDFDVTVNDDANIYDGTAQLPIVTVTRKGSDQPLVPGTDFEVSLATTDPAQDNVNANVDKDGNLLPDKGHIKINITGKGNYTSTVKEDGNETEVPVEKEFDIQQRNIADCTVAEIDALTFNNAKQTPTPEVSFTDSKNQKYTLNYQLSDTRAIEYTYAYANNKYVGAKTDTDAPTCTIQAYPRTETEATQETPATVTYTGNFYGTKDVTFAINKFAFTLKPEGQSKYFAQKDPELVATTDPALPTGATLPTILENKGTENEPSYYTISRVAGEHVSVYAVTITNVALSTEATENDTDNQPIAKSAPSNNYTMDVEGGTFEIVKADGKYFVTSKFVQKDYNGEANVPFEGYYLYRLENNEYVEIPAKIDDKDNPIFKLIVGPTANVLNETGNGAGRNVRWSNGVGSAIWSWAIVPDVTGLSTDEYTLATAPNIHHAEGEHNGEGYMQVNPRTVFLVADDKESAYGEALVTPTTTIYDYKLEGTEKVIDKTKVLTGFTLNFNAPTVVGVTQTSEIKKHEGAIQFNGYYGTGSNRQTIANANRNYKVITVAGDYTITAATATVTVAVTWTKTLGQEDSEANMTYTATLKGNDITLTAAEVEEIKLHRATGASEAINKEGYTLTVGENADFEGPAKLNGEYPATYTGKLIILPKGEVEIVLNNQTINYPVSDAVTTLSAPYAAVTGLTAAQIAEYGLSIAYTKPATGFVKNGATLQVKCGDVLVGESGEGHVVTATEWAWVANFEKVTVKSANLYVNAADEITLDMIAFNKASYTDVTEKDAKATDQLIRDYDGSKVKKVNIISSKQEFKVQPDNWYTMVLPFATTPRQISNFFNGYAAIDILSENHMATKASDIMFKLTMGGLDANTPFIVKTDEKFTFGGANSYFADDKGILIEYPELDAEGNWVNVPMDGSGNKFIGTYTAINGFEAGKYDIINLAGNINPAAANTYLRALGAYIQVADGVNNAAVRVYIEEPDGTITAINGVEAENGANAEGVYNLSGQRVSRAQRGIYIKDGKKVLVK